MEMIKEEIADLIDYCYHQAEEDSDGMTAHDVWLEVAQRLHNLKLTVERNDNPNNDATGEY